MPRRPNRTDTKALARPRQSKDSPEQWQEGTTEPTGAGTPNSAPVPLVTTPHFDNPLNPRGISSNLCNGVPDNQATDAQKVQNPTPARAPQAATTYPMVIGERVSAGQNRLPPEEVIP